MATEEFNSLAFPNRPIADFNMFRYYIYRTEKDYVAVEASSAVDALKKSGIENPFKVMHEVTMRSYILGFDELATKDDATSQAAPTAEPPAEAVPPAAEASNPAENIPPGGIEAKSDS